MMLQHVQKVEAPTGTAVIMLEKSGELAGS